MKKATLYSLIALAICCPAYAAEAGEGGNANGANKPEELVPPAPSAFIQEAQDSQLSYDEIMALKKFMRDTKRAAAAPVEEPPLPEIGMIQVDLSPGAVPPIVRLSENEGSSIVFLDSSGTPWTVQSFTNFASKLATVTSPLKDGHILTIEPKSPFGNGNLAVFLQGLSTPITITLMAGQKNVDYRLDMRVPRRLSSSTPGDVIAGNPSFGSSDATGADPLLMDVIQNTVHAANVEKINATGADVLAWVKKTGDTKTILIRTQGILLAPVAIDGKKVIASDGTKAYEIRLTPLVTILLNGRSHNVSLDFDI